MVINGTSGPDTLAGTADADTINGLDGNDTLSGGGLANALNGGNGDDYLYAAAGGSVLDGGEGRDTVDFSSATGGTAGRVGAEVDLSSGKATYNFITFRQIGNFSGPFPASAMITLRNIEVVLGGPVDDTLIAGAAAASFFGGNGADTLIGGAGDDLLRGGAGADKLTGGGGADTFAFGSAESTSIELDSIADFQSGQDRLTLESPLTVALVRQAAGTLVFAGERGLSQPQTVIGVNGTIQGGDLYVNGVNPNLQMVGDDRAGTLIGGTGDDILSGGGGADTLQGGRGADVLYGGAGADVFVYTSNDGPSISTYDIIADWESGIDKIDLTQRVFGNGTEVIIRRVGQSTFVEAFLGYVGVTGQVQATDIITSRNSGFVMYGDEAANLLIGGSGRDFIQGGLGADVLTGGAGADQFQFGATDSTAAAYDVITDFQSGSDTITFAGGPGTRVSVVRNGGSTFVFASTPGGALQIGVTGVANGADIVTNQGLVPILMLGDGAANTMVGNIGEDTLIGRGGRDILTGGAGADTFRYDAASDSPLTGGDFITDFVSGTDKLDLRGVHTSAADRYGVAGAGSGAYVFVDLGGDGVNDMVIALDKVTSLQPSDILF